MDYQPHNTPLVNFALAITTIFTAGTGIYLQQIDLILGILVKLISIGTGVWFFISNWKAIKTWCKSIIENYRK